MSNQAQANTPEGSGVGGYLALVLGWLVPGLGHWMLGEKARGMIFAVAVHGLFAAGMLIAGIRAINPPEQQIWTYTQYLTGWPMIVASKIEKRKIQELNSLVTSYQVPSQRPPVDDDSRRAERIEAGKAMIERHPLFAYHPKPQDIGAVYCGIAGMLNLLILFDILLRITGSKRETPGSKNKPSPAAEGAQ